MDKLNKRLKALGQIMVSSLNGVVATNPPVLKWNSKFDTLDWSDPSFPPPNNTAPGAFGTYTSRVKTLASQQLVLITGGIFATDTPHSVAENTAYNWVKGFVESHHLSFAGGLLSVNELPVSVRNELKTKVGLSFASTTQALWNYIEATIMSDVTATPL